MQPLAPITKTEFLEFFKNADRYVKFNYIEQETFFCNMVYVMGVTKKVMPMESKSTLEKFDEALFRRGVMTFLRSMEPENWRKFDNLSEKMQADANSHLFAAGTDLAGIVIGEAVGGAAKKMTKSISRPYRKTAAFIGKPEGNNMKVMYNRLDGTKDIVNRVEVKANLKTSNSVWGTDVLDWKKFGRTDIEIEFALDPNEVLFNHEIGKGVEYVHQNVAPGGRFSFGDTVMGEKMDVVTDYVPYLGKAKAFVSSVANLAIGCVYSKSADRLAQIEGAGKAATREYIQTHLCVDVEKDLKALDKKTLFRMLQFVPEIDNRPVELRK